MCGRRQSAVAVSLRRASGEEGSPLGSRGSPGASGRASGAVGWAAWAAASPTIVPMRLQAGCAHGYRLRREQLRFVVYDGLDHIALDAVAAAHLVRVRLRAERRAP